MERTLKVSEETYQKIKDQLQQEEKINISNLQDFVGKKVFLRTVTYHLVGRVVKVVGSLLFLEEASWVADSGRFTDAIKEGELSEVEPLGDWFVNFTTVVDGGFWNHDLPTKQK